MNANPSTQHPSSCCGPRSTLSWCRPSTPMIAARTLPTVPLLPPIRTKRSFGAPHLPSLMHLRFVAEGVPEDVHELWHREHASGIPGEDRDHEPGLARVSARHGPPGPHRRHSRRPLRPRPDLAQVQGGVQERPGHDRRGWELVPERSGGHGRERGLYLCGLAQRLLRVRLEQRHQPAGRRGARP